MIRALRRAATVVIAATAATLFIAPAASAADGADGSWEFDVTVLKTATITNYTGADSAVVVPNEVTYSGADFCYNEIPIVPGFSICLGTITDGETIDVTSVASSFNDNYAGPGLSSVTLPTGIIAHANSFSGLGLTSLIVEGEAAIGTGAFADNLLTQVSLPAGTFVGDGAFADNRLEQITLGAGVNNGGGLGLFGSGDLDVAFPASSQTSTALCDYGNGSLTSTGWFTEPQPDGVAHDVDANMTLYTHWDMVAVTLSAPSTTYTSTTLCVPTGTAPDLTGVELPEKTGHTLLDEWLDSEDNTYLLTDTFDQDVELFAQFEANDYTVTFDPATDADAPLDVTVTYGDTVADPGHPDWDLHVFQAWVDDAETPWDFSTPVEGDMTLTGTWCERSVVAPASVHQGEVLEITGSCFEPGESVTFTLNSDPLALGTVTADADGMVTVSATIPVEFATGAHSVTVVGDATGTSTVDVEVLAVLPPTGFGSAGIAAGAAGLLVAGALVLGLRRRALA